MVRREQLSRPNITDSLQTAGCEGALSQLNRVGISIWIAGDLAGDPIVAMSVGKKQSRAKLALA